MADIRLGLKLSADPYETKLRAAGAEDMMKALEEISSDPFAMMEKLSPILEGPLAPFAGMFGMGSQPYDPYMYDDDGYDDYYGLYDDYDDYDDYWY